MAEARGLVDEIDYFYRVFRALTDCGRRVLLHLLQRRVGELTPKDHLSQPWSLDEFLHHNKAVILLSIGKDKRHDNTLYPFRRDTDLTKWDIHLLALVLLKACKLDNDLQLKHDIFTLRNLMDKLLHTGTPTLAEVIYHSYFGRIVGVVQRICDYMQEPGLKESLLKELYKYQSLTHTDIINEEKARITNEDYATVERSVHQLKMFCRQKGLSINIPDNDIVLLFRPYNTNDDQRITERLTRLFTKALEHGKEMLDERSSKEKLKDEVMSLVREFIKEKRQILAGTDDPDYFGTNVYDVDICLRGYQHELAKEGCEGKNVIVMAPLNSGKTRVACRIMQVHLRQKRAKGKKGRILLLVENEALAIQLGNVCEKLLPTYRTKVFSGNVHRLKREMLWDFLELRDIFVVTAQIFLNALIAKKIQIVGDFSLIVVDECHRSNKQHMYNEIMSRYIDLKLRENVDFAQLPQIVGLTSSLGVGGRTEWDQGLNHMKKLMANMDAKFLCTVKTPLTIEELKIFVNSPVEELLPVPGRNVDWFENAVGEIAKRIDAHMSQHQIVLSASPEDEFIQTKCRLPETFGTEIYLQWNAEFATNIAKVRSKDIRRVLNPCRLHLEAYNEALMMHCNSKTRNAFAVLEEFMEDFRVVPAKHPTDAFIMALYDDILPVPGRDVDWFTNDVKDIAKRIDDHMAKHGTVRSAPPEDEFIQTKCRLPETFGTEKYLQWSAEFVKHIAKVRSKDIRRVLNPCRLHLEAYNKALMIHRDATKRDAFVSLEEFMEDFRVVPAKHPTDAFIMALYDELREISFNTEPDNPKLLKLKEILTGVLCNEQNARGIIFVRTGELAQALVRWVNETDSLNVLNASEIAEDSLNVLHAAEFVGQSDSASVEENNRQVVFVVHATADQDYAESLCKYLEDKGYVCIQSGHDYQPLDSHQKSVKDTITITNKTLFIVTANSLQQFTKIIRNVLSNSPGLKDDKVSVLLSFMTGSEATQFCNGICELIPFGILPVDVITVADVRRFQTSVFKRGVTKSGQKDVLEYFKNGKHRLLIATSVAEEGLDISKCNLVIRYEHVTDEIVRLQSRGRARAENSLYYVIAEEGSCILEKEERNRRCEELMNQIVPHLQVIIEDHAHILERELLEIQEKMKQEERRQAVEKELHMAVAGARFECFNCSSFICLSDDIRVINGAHHIIIDEEAKRHLTINRGAPFFIEPEGAQYGGALYCANEECQRELGSVCTYKHSDFPLIGLKNFRLVDRFGKGRAFKKWKHVNCGIEEITLEELEAVVAERLANV